ncbi:4-hydroxythreonine-4-phosphate dehydrogenase PdxA [Candidatus Thiodubiliella endoseptemdiera]|uniref:4-hydroxythreonine-4-phosphate dehydrogenase PdxA n=1 Tax=Candidatus Thiodubiliella endoseptemdiera TaxID=2738886 RepID=A0A853F477_9GAMM|nr:4-hydroxythreonine-4-phosphate dehydrogenase PdxA [Candidatus Thiodubiliella endoseptemdiera]
MLIFTPGEPAGIGPDLAVMIAQEKTAQDLLVFADPDVLLTRAKILGLTLKISETESTSQDKSLCVYPVKIADEVVAGKLNKDNAAYVLKTLDLATQYCLDKKAQALVTGPLHKGVINQANIYQDKNGKGFSGHTEYLAQRANIDKTVMMLATEGLRVALATTHIPLSQVSKNIQTDSLTQTLHIIHYSLQGYGLQNPKIVVCGLNPHAGEDGYLGREEIEIINPLIKKLNTQGFNLVGSVPADTAFTPDALRGVDCVLAMYHDQGLPVLKTLGFKKSVNVTLGLPFIRTSVDHGTALNLAGTGNISMGSLHTAIAYAKDLINRGK